MAIPIRTFVDVNITRATQGVSRQGFGTPLILAEVSSFFDRTKSYSGLTELGEDFSSTSAVYLKASAIFGQNPRPKIVKVGRKYANVNSKQNIEFNAEGSGGTFKLKVGDLAETAGIAYDANVATIKGALEGVSGITEVTVTQVVAKKEWTVEFTGADANKHFGAITVTSYPTSVTSAEIIQLQYGSATESWSDALDNVCIFDDDFYGLCITSKQDADISAIASNIQARSKIFIALTNDADVVGSGSADIASVLNTAGYTRTAVIYTDDTDGQHDGAWLGRMLPKVVGKATWAFKDLEGENVTIYNTTARGYAMAKKANIFHLVGGKRIMDNGTMASGEFIDNMLCIDFLIARIGEDIFQALTDADKIPYTDAGVGVIVSILNGRLSSAVSQGILDTYTAEAPKVADIPVADRANRLLPDVEFSGRLQGAIHEIVINGKVSV